MDVGAWRLSLRATARRDSSERRSQKVAALHWLTQAEELHDALLVQLRVDPFLDPIRKDAQFKAIDGRLNFPPQLTLCRR